MTDRPKFTMPTWMEQYRECFQNTGGNTIEDLMNDTGTNAFSNAVRSALIISVDSQVTLLLRLHEAGALREADGDPIRWDGNGWTRMVAS